MIIELAGQSHPCRAGIRRDLRHRATLGPPIRPCSSRKATIFSPPKLRVSWKCGLARAARCPAAAYMTGSIVSVDGGSSI